MTLGPQFRELSEAARSTSPEPFTEAADQWAARQRQALSLGLTTPQSAQERGYHFSGHEVDHRTGGQRWTRLPEALYHVTTSAPAVLEQGLKTREERGIGTDKGLGGSGGDAISTTSDRRVAEGILSGLRIVHSVLNGSLDHRDLLRMAESGHEGSAPFHVPLRESLARAHGGWDDASMTTRQVWRGAGAEHVPLTPEEHQDRQFRAAKAFLGHRDAAGGPPDPYFFQTDTRALAAADPSHFAILSLRGEGHGYPMSGMSEWRTHHGSALRTLSAQFGTG